MKKIAILLIIISISIGISLEFTPKTFDCRAFVAIAWVIFVTAIAILIILKDAKDTNFF